MSLGKISKSVLKYIHIDEDDEDFEYIVYELMKGYLRKVDVTDDERRLSKEISIRFGLDQVACNLSVGLFMSFYNSRKISVLDAQTLLTMSEVMIPSGLSDIEPIKRELDRCCHRNDLFTLKLLVTLCSVVSRDWLEFELDPRRVKVLITLDSGPLFEVLAMCCYASGIFKGSHSFDLM